MTYGICGITKSYSVFLISCVFSGDSYLYLLLYRLKSGPKKNNKYNNEEVIKLIV